MTVELKSKPWQRLAGKFDSAVLTAPKTGGDPMSKGEWPEVQERIVTYLERTVRGAPWADHLALIAAVMTAHRCDVQTVMVALWSLHPRFTALFTALGYVAMTDWNPERAIPAYLKEEVLPDDDQGMRAVFWRSYSSASKHLKKWAESLPEVDRRRYQRLILPVVNPLLIEGLYKGQDVLRRQRQNRKAETDAVVPHFAAIRAEAHFRYNRLARLRQAYNDALRGVKPDSNRLPIVFSYEEGADLERGFPPQERLHFRVWDRRSFVLAHPENYSRNIVTNAEHGQDAFSEKQNSLFLEFVKTERLVGNAPPEGFWFEELIKRDVLGANPKRGSPREIAAKLEWLQAWGYCAEDADTPPVPFLANIPGLIVWSRTTGDSMFMATAQSIAEGVLIPVEQFYAAATFGLLAVDLFTTTGMRINEALQVRLTQDCFVRLVMPAPPGAKDASPRVRYAFRLIPKGERMDKAHDYFIGEETKRLLVKVGQMLGEHYGLQPGASLPVVAFHQTNARAHRFGKAPYLFQYGGRHLTDEAITACLRFLLHGMAFRTREGQLVVLKAHLLRHAFATHVFHVEKIPLDIVGALLKQKNLDVTDYYSQVTQTMVAEAADIYLARIAAHVNVQEVVRRSPDELQKLYEEARGKVGTLSEVIGGTCVMHGLCPAKFACVGCAGKVPDPSKRYQVEQKKKWAEQQVNYAIEEGLYPEAERMKQLVRDCEIELQEMDLIEAYRRDETNVPFIRLEPLR
jgi:hypothetical protein